MQAIFYSESEGDKTNIKCQVEFWPNFSFSIAVQLTICRKVQIE